MKISKSQLATLSITDIEGLDPITVVLADLGPGKGKIIIECYGDSWSSYWGGMGERNISAFFASCDEHYLAKKLSNIRSEITDFDQIQKDCEEKGLGIEVSESHDLHMHYSALEELYGERLYDLPEKPNPDYQYLCRILKAVQEAMSKI